MTDPSEILPPDEVLLVGRIWKPEAVGPAPAEPENDQVRKARQSDRELARE